jgi:hypothetical protein
MAFTPPAPVRFAAGVGFCTVAAGFGEVPELTLGLEAGAWIAVPDTLAALVAVPVALAGLIALAALVAPVAALVALVAAVAVAGFTLPAA